MMRNSDDAFKTIERIREAKGKSKRYLLSEALIPYLKAAYDPFKQYYIKRKEDEAYACPGTKRFDDDTWSLLKRLSSRDLSGMAAQRAVDDELELLTIESGKLLIRILNKDLRMGMASKSINSVYPNSISVHEIMLAKLYDHSRVVYPCWASVKIDGVRAVFKHGHFYSRKGHQFDGLKHLEAELADFSEPLDGELIVPDVSFQVSSGMIRMNGPTPDAQFHIFELPTIQAPFEDRVTMMDDLDEYGPHVKAVKHVIVFDETELLEFYIHCLEQGFEGSVIKTYDYNYVNTRSFHWMKLKPKMKDLELKVIGVYEGEGKYRGMLGGIIVRYYGSRGVKEVKIGSGFTDKQRKEYWLLKSYVLYRMAQCEAMEETDGGSLRHPVFKEINE